MDTSPLRSLASRACDAETALAATRHALASPGHPQHADAAADLPAREAAYRDALRRVQAAVALALEGVPSAPEGKAAGLAPERRGTGA